MGFRPDINGLRAVAVISVVLYHFGIPGFAGGFVGVDVFFVISGFLMTHAVMSKLATGSFHVLEFYLARARRIVPALAVVCATLLVVGYRLLLPLEYGTLSKQALSAVSFVSNVVFWQERGYFDTASQTKLLLHTWSLSVEWQFYLLFPLLVLALHRWAGVRRVTIGLLVLALGSLALCVVGTRLKPEAAFFLLPTRTWELLAGSLVYLLRSRLKLALLVPPGLLAIAVAALCYDDSLWFPGAWALLPVLGTAAVIAADSKARVLTNRVMQFIGTTSYSIYLVHWPLVVWSRRLALPSTPLVLSLLALSTLVLGYASYRFVETPFRRFGQHLPARSALLAQLVAPGLVALLALAIWQRGGLPHRVPPLAAANDRASIDSGHPELCPTTAGVCQIGPQQEKKVLFWGDSHVEHLYPALLSLAPRALASGHQLLMAVNHGCLPVRGFDARGHRAHCDHKNERVWELATGKDVDVVVIGSIWTPYFREELYDFRTKPTLCVIDGGSCLPLTDAAEALRRVEARLGEDVSALVARGKRVHLVAPVPAYTTPVAQALALELWRGNPAGVALSREQHLRAQRSLLDVLQSVARKTGARLIDPTEVYCPGASCVFARDGVSIYRDKNHLTSVGARMLAPALEPTVSGS